MFHAFYLFLNIVQMSNDEDSSMGWSNVGLINTANAINLSEHTEYSNADQVYVRSATFENINSSLNGGCILYSDSNQDSQMLIELTFFNNCLIPNDFFIVFIYKW